MALATTNLRMRFLPNVCQAHREQDCHDTAGDKPVPGQEIDKITVPVQRPCSEGTDRRAVATRSADDFVQILHDEHDQENR